MSEMTYIHKIPTKGMTKEEWLAEREKSIGGSEIGAIMGMSPWSSPLSVYCERKGITPPFEGNLATQVGTYLEEFVAKRFQEISGLKVNRTNFLYRNDFHPHLHASPDRLIIGPGQKPIAGLECKTTSVYNARKVHDVDFPDIYYCQCVQYMMVTGLRTWYLAVLVGNSEFHIFMLTMDDGVEKPDWCESKLYVPLSDCEALQTQADAFWSMLELGVMPEASGTKADGDAIKTIAEGLPGGKADLFGYEKILAQYEAAKRREDDAKKEAEKLAQQIQLGMGGADEGECIGYRVKWKEQAGRQTFDWKACVEKYPEATQYLKTGKPFRKFEVKKV